MALQLSDYFSAAFIKNKTNKIFIDCNGLGNSHNPLIKGKPYNVLCVTNLDSICNWESALNWLNVTFEDSDTPYKAKLVVFGFKTKSLQDNLRFQFIP